MAGTVQSTGLGLVALVGPTASGKSEVAVQLAEQCAGEIISVDSMQVYRGMDIGTAKTPLRERGRVPHHLIDIAELSTTFDAAQFLSRANGAIAEIRERGHLPVLCGGTGLYLKALFHGLGQSPGGDPAVRAELERTPLPALLLELAKADPLTYQQIDQRNSRRVLRAMEVIRLTGKPYSAQRADWRETTQPGEGTKIFGLERDSWDLQQRIDARVDAMFEQGLVEETEKLLAAGLTSNRTALQALGYRQVVEYFQGARSLAETIQLVKTRTRQFAKRQMTWFRRQLPVEWIQVARGDTAQEIVSRIRARVDQGLV